MISSVLPSELVEDSVVLEDFSEDLMSILGIFSRHFSVELEAVDDVVQRSVKISRYDSRYHSRMLSVVRVAR